jgi:hypothetical protein
MAVQTFPRPVNPKIKKQTDDQLAKVGQLNQLVKDVNGLNVTGPSPVSYGFEWYPEAGLTTGGAKFTYVGGVELISYHIKGITPVGGDGGFNQYLCTVNFPQGNPFLFAGSINGMFQINTGGGNITNTPLANGALVDIGGDYYPISNFEINLETYGNNPQPDGSYYYALVMSATVTEPGQFSAVVAYDFEFLLPNFVTPPTIFQD